MKKTILSLTIFLGVFFVAGMASASDVETLQPASAITYNEDLTVNGTGRFDSVYIGKQDIGGVTFFNGTIVNSTTGDGDSDNPVTFGDGVRIDGLIWGGPNKGNVTDQALKIADTLLPGLTNINDLGSSSLRWKTLYVENVNVNGNLIWSEPKEYIMSIPGVACTGLGATPKYSLGYCEMGFEMLFEVNLPNKSKVKSFSGYMQTDVPSPGEISCKLYKSEFSYPGNIVKMSTIAVEGSTTLKWATDTTIDSSEINNNSNNYFIRCSGPATPGTRLSGFKIKYEKSFID